MDRRSRVLPVLAVIIAMTVGFAVYLTDRQVSSVYLIPNFFTLSGNIGPVFGDIGYWLPTFVHAFVFILLTAIVVTPSSSAHIALICIAWFSIDSLFELAQITLFAKWIAAHVPDWFSYIPILDNTAAYFRSGTFDVLDLVSIAAGTVTAYLILNKSLQWRKNHVSISR